MPSIKPNRTLVTAATRNGRTIMSAPIRSHRLMAAAF